MTDLSQKQMDILRSLARSQAQTEDIVDDYRAAYQAKMRELLDDPTERDAKLWHDALAAISDDLEWIISVVTLPLSAFQDEGQDLDTTAAFVRAAEVQAAVETIVPEVLAVGEDREGLLGEAAGLTRAQSQEMGKVGVTKTDVKENRRPRDADS
jgi:hypothetical protein